MRTISIWIMCCASLASCLKPRVEELDFFRVEMKKARAVAVGQVVLEGNLINKERVDACGFYYSEQLTELYNNIDDADSVQSAVPALSGAFEVDFYEINQEQVLYFRAFARQGARTVYSDSTLSYTLGELIRLSGMPGKSNDTMIVSGRVSGLQNQGLKVDEHGHVYSSQNKLPAIGEPDCERTKLGLLNDDTVFTSRIPNLLFNTTYYVRAYALIGNVPYYSKTVDSVLIEDGWKIVDSFPMPFQGGVGIGVDDYARAFVGFGCNSNDCVQEVLTKNLFSYTPDVQGGVWENNSEAPFNGPFMCTDAATFRIGDTIYYYGGEARPMGFSLVNAGSQFKKYAFISDKWSWSQPDLPGKRTRAVAFSIEVNGTEKGYMGAGRGAGNQQLNDFWEYNPSSNAWRKVANLPLRISADATTSGGRESAVVFSNGGEVYVGGGFVGATYLQDFWKFIPPESPQDTGKWEFVGFFEGAGRIEAAFFTLGNRGYYGLGYNGILEELNDFWEFDFATHAWRRITPDFPGKKRARPTSFSLLNKGYVLGGIRIENNEDIILPLDCWQYTPKQ